ncbi:hypothetical protein [Sphingomonas insulae]|uniref:hypothetical protein n=1 Tax=Sphingomonas insulae TaxID=424800 RepID=UPI0013D66DC3|nr:hypothetical protein [Sphingomonas insulae]
MSVAYAASSSGQGKPNDEIAATGRRMRNVRLSYDWTGRSLQQCRIERSSGDPEIDRTMCRILSTCIQQGRSSNTQAKRCMMRRVKTMIEEAQHLGMSRILSITDEMPDANRPAGTPIDAGSNVPHTGAPDGDIVIEGRRDPIRGGLWQIERTSVFGRGGAGEMPMASPRSFNICLPDTSVRQMLERAVNERLRRPGTYDCGPIALAVGPKYTNLRFTCPGRSGENVLGSLAGKHAVSLVYGEDKRGNLRDDAITAIHTIELDRRGSQATFRRGGKGELATYVMYFNAVRIGDCPASGEPDPAPRDEVMPLLFGLDEIFDEKGHPRVCPKWWKSYIPVQCGQYFQPASHGFDSPDMDRDARGPLTMLRPER